MEIPKEIFHNTIHEALGIKVKELSPDQVVLTMPVDERTRQVMGYLHGGASVVLAESAASIGTYLNLNPAFQTCFGIEINASHLLSKKSGIVTAVAVPLRKGQKQMVWSIEVLDEDQQLLCISRCTVRVTNKRAGDPVFEHDLRDPESPMPSK